MLNQASDMLHGFYGKNSSYAHRGLDSNGKPADAVYGQKEIHGKVMSQNFTNCHTKICHVDAHATQNDGVVVQAMELLSNNNQALWRFMQTFVLAAEGSVVNKFYVHNDIFRYQDEIFGGFVTEPQEEEVGEPEERQQTAEVVPDDSGTFYNEIVSNDSEEHLEEKPVVELEPEQEPEHIREDTPEPALEEAAPEDVQKEERFTSPSRHVPGKGGLEDIFLGICD